jgi:hypothetical protein
MSCDILYIQLLSQQIEIIFDPSLIFEEVGIHLSESAMFFAGCFLSMIIRSEGQEEIVSLFYFENNSCPFWCCESIEFYAHHALVDECAISRWNQAMPSYFSQLKFG